MCTCIHVCACVCVCMICTCAIFMCGLYGLNAWHVCMYAVRLYICMICECECTYWYDLHVWKRVYAYMCMSLCMMIIWVSHSWVHMPNIYIYIHIYIYIYIFIRVYDARMTHIIYIMYVYMYICIYSPYPQAKYVAPI